MKATDRQCAESRRTRGVAIGHRSGLGARARHCNSICPIRESAAKATLAWAGNYLAMTLSGSLCVRISAASSTMSSRIWAAGLISLMSPTT